MTFIEERISELAKARHQAGERCDVALVTHLDFHEAVQRTMAKVDAPIGDRDMSFLLTFGETDATGLFTALGTTRVYPSPTVMPGDIVFEDDEDDDGPEDIATAEDDEKWKGL